MLFVQLLIIKNVLGMFPWSFGFPVVSHSGLGEARGILRRW